MFRPSARPLLAFVGSAGICILLVELALRLFWHNPYLGENDRILLIRTHHPHKHRIYHREFIDPDSPEVRLDTDASGFLLPSFQHAHPDATIAFLGGSTTECTAVLPELRFPARVSERLAVLGIRANTLNAARSGNTLHDSINAFFNHVALAKPDFVVAMHAANDIGMLREPGGYAKASAGPLSLAHGGRWLRQAASRHSSLFGWARSRIAAFDFRPAEVHRDVFERDLPIAADRLPIVEYERRLRAFIGVVRALDAVPVLMTQPLTTQRTELTPRWADLGAQARFNETIRKVARSESCLLVDLAAYMRDEVDGWDEPMRFFYDGMHVTDAGSEIYAEHIVDVLLPTLRERRSARRGAETRR